ncbi:MAG: DEAD/DEAH box helicase [Candidatus Micrarchaeota archaeon]
MDAATLAETLLKLGYDSLNPMQSDALAAGLVESDRTVVCAPTASGKTLLALLRMVANHSANGSKAIYVVPLKALAQEKKDEFSEVLAPFQMSVAAASSDYDSAGEQYAAADVIIATVEKLDSMMRHRPTWFSKVGLAVIDEAHLLGDDHRGSTLEMVFVKLLQQDCRLLALSATIGNAKEIAAWLDAKLFEHSYRPTKLSYRIATKKLVYSIDGARLSKSVQVKGDPVRHLVLEAVLRGGQAIVFVASRRAAEAQAEELASIISGKLSAEDLESCKSISEKALHALPNPTSQCTALSKCIAAGVSFHHAGIAPKQRKAIEDGFKRARAIKAIVATTTLAMGVDYPASVVVVRDLKRFTGAFSEFIPKFEVRQMAGRAGRPRYDKEGLAVLVCGEKDLDYVLDEYVNGEVEDLQSKLSSAAVLRMHALGLVASGHCKSSKELHAFFGRTLFAHQYQSTEELFGMVDSAVGELKEFDFLAERATGALLPTPVGKRVSELYVDPLSASFFAEFIKAKGDKASFDFLMAINCATEMLPLLTVKRGEEQEVFRAAESETYHPFIESQFDDYNFVSKFKSSKLLAAWIDERTEEEMLEQFDAPPGLLYSRLRNAEWLCYAMQELAYSLNQPSMHAQAKRLRRRLKHGIKEELLSICSIKGVGRVRGRKLFSAGIRTSEELAATPRERIREILRSQAGAVIAASEIASFGQPGK